MHPKRRSDYILTCVKNMLRWLVKRRHLLIVLMILFIVSIDVFSQSATSGIPSVNLSVSGGNPDDNIAAGIQIILVLTVITLAPAIILMMTSFTRIVIVLSFLRQAMAVQQIPPAQVLIGLSLFLTFFVMSPVLKQVHSDALKPYLDKEISFQTALKEAEQPVRKFMLAQIRKKDLSFFLKVSKSQRPKTLNDISMLVIIPAFIISELKTAFIIGFLIYIPFLILDMIVASILLSMGMIMLPPVVISLPFKLLLFVLVDGWYLICGSIINSFQ